MDSLVDRLQALPLILAGPILRRVTASSVTVWVVLKNAATVSLQIGDAVARTPVGSAATQPTIAIGRFLHMVAITAPVSLVPGVVRDRLGVEVRAAQILRRFRNTSVPANRRIVAGRARLVGHDQWLSTCRVRIVRSHCREGGENP